MEKLRKLESFQCGNGILIEEGDEFYTYDFGDNDIETHIYDRKDMDLGGDVYGIKSHACEEMARYFEIDVYPYSNSMMTCISTGEKADEAIDIRKEKFSYLVEKFIEEEDLEYNIDMDSYEKPPIENWYKFLKREL